MENKITPLCGSPDDFDGTHLFRSDGTLFAKFNTIQDLEFALERINNYDQLIKVVESQQLFLVK